MLKDRKGLGCLNESQQSQFTTVAALWRCHTELSARIRFSALRKREAEPQFSMVVQPFRFDLPSSSLQATSNKSNHRPWCASRQPIPHTDLLCLQGGITDFNLHFFPLDTPRDSSYRTSAQLLHFVTHISLHQDVRIHRVRLHPADACFCLSGLLTTRRPLQS
jgi:hypothetical protein